MISGQINKETRTGGNLTDYINKDPKASKLKTKLDILQNRANTDIITMT